MQQYKTVEEKSAEWKISMRYIQNLCKRGKIEGAIKKAGVWLIPEEIKNPAKRQPPSNNNRLEFSGTKKEIFDKSLDLFVEHGFEDVSMRAIAKAVGIRQPAIYNHFASKQEILDTIYDFFRCYLFADRPDLEELKPILKNGSLMDILMFVWYEFKEDYKMELSQAIKIVFFRAGIDETAKEIAKSILIEDGNKFCKDVFDLAIETGRLAPLDTRAMGIFLNGIRMYTLVNWLVDDSPEYMYEVDRDQRILFGHATKLLTDLNPPG